MENKIEKVEKRKNYAFTFMLKDTENSNNYIVFFGTYGETRIEMFKIYGDQWAFQYELDSIDFQDHIKKYKLNLITGTNK